MQKTEFIKNLQHVVGESHVSLSGADAEIYSYDASLVKGAPDVIAFPADTRDVSELARLAYKSGVPFLARGFGTNLSGGTVPTSGGLVISLTRLNKVLDIQPDGRYAVVQPGVTNLELQNALVPLGFFYAPDPASQKVATMGGNLAENSGGPRCVKYGVTTNHILGMEFVLPNGEIVHLGGAALDPPGYDLRGLAIGSEGTFGIATEITVRILAKAEKVITMLAVYDRVADAAKSVADIIAAGIVPATLEMMDSLVIQAVEDSYACGYPRDAAAVLIIEVEGPGIGLDDQAERIQKICTGNGCREIKKARDDSERDRLWEGRRGAFGAIARLAPNYLVNDCTVPRTKLPQALEYVADISEKYGFRHGNVFHAGDGNLHPLLFFDSRESDELQRVKKAGWEIMERCVELGGTISGEHGIGVEKMPAMGLIQSEDELDFQRKIKSVFDAKNLLNPGKVIPEPNSQIKRVCAPIISDSELEIAEKIKKALESGNTITPTGLGNHFGSFMAALKTGDRLNCLSLDDMVDYDISNQTISMGAGATLKSLQSALEVNNQWLPVSPPFSHRDYTLGGLIATGACGPERIYYGAPRDLLLGLRFIDGQGRLISTGGKVMKNVAGYDMTRLMAGSAGSLGFIAEVTLRVSSLPERSVAISATGSPEACTEAANQLNRSTLQPVFTVMVNGAEDGLTKGTWVLKIGFEGFGNTVTFQLSEANSLLEKSGLSLLGQNEYLPAKGIFGDTFQNLDSRRYVIRIDLPPNRIREFISGLKTLSETENEWIDLGSGRIFCGVSVISTPVWEQINSLARRYGGHAILQKSADSFNGVSQTHGLPGVELALMRRLKNRLDPKKVFVSGVFA